MKIMIAVCLTAEESAAIEDINAPLLSVDDGDGGKVKLTAANGVTHIEIGKKPVAVSLAKK